MSNLKKRYREKIVGQLQEKFQYDNPNKVPRLLKIVINMGIGEVCRDKNAVQDCFNELALIAGQKPVFRKAKKSISNFKIREGQPVGLKVTLRGSRMYDFMERTCKIVWPRIRDFRGFKSRCDSKGNYTLGIDDHQIFPELNLDLVKRSQGMDISYVTSAASDEECVELLRLLGMPFKDQTVEVTM